jgi:hypothetical protein
MAKDSKMPEREESKTDIAYSLSGTSLTSDLHFNNSSVIIFILSPEFGFFSY